MSANIREDISPVVWTDVVNIKLAIPSATNDINYIEIPGGKWQICNVGGYVFCDTDTGAADSVAIGKYVVSGSTFTGGWRFLSGSVESGAGYPFQREYHSGSTHYSLALGPMVIDESALSFVAGENIGVKTATAANLISGSVNIQLARQR